MKTFTKALVFASVKHQSQRRKQAGDIPYINHPLEVVHILSQAGIKDEQILAAAVLHDTVEDTATTPEQLEQQFGERVKNLVLECTDDKSLGKVQRKRVQIKKALKASNDAKLIKMADKISNNRGLLVKAPENWTPERTRGYLVWSQFVCNNLRGNQILDKQIESIFERSGINEMQQEQKQKFLEYYYEGLK